MKRIIFSLISAVIATSMLSAQCGNLYINTVVDGPLGGGTPKGIQLCASGAIADLSIYGIGAANNGGGTDGVEFSAFAGTLAMGDCIWLASESTEFTNYFGFAPDYTNGTAAGINGDDAVELFCDPTMDGDFSDAVVEDLYGDINMDGSGTCWDHLDGFAINNTSTPNLGVFDCANYFFSGVDALDGCTTNATCAAVVTTANPPTTCTIDNFSITNMVCNGADLNFDVNFNALNLVDAGGVIEVFDNTNMAVLTTTASSPVTVTLAANTGGTIDVLLRDATDNSCASSIFTLNTLDCSLTSCQTLMCPDLQIAPITLNSEMDNWTCDQVSMNSWSANGFVSGSTAPGETSDLWLIAGEYDLTGSTQVVLNLDANENFSGSGLEIFVSTSFSGCPSDAANSWASVGTIASGGGAAALTFDLSAYAGATSVYIGIQYLSGSAGGSASGWDISNVSITADACPTINAPIFANCCTADAGALAADALPATCLDAAATTFTLTATETTAPAVPTDYEVLYFLTYDNGTDLVLESTGFSASFDIFSAANGAQLGDYAIHTVVAEISDIASPNYFDLAGITLGTTTAADLVAQNSSVCFGFDLTGAQFTITACAIMPMVSISDPCSCQNAFNPGTFAEVVTVTSGVGETWTVQSTTNLTFINFTDNFDGTYDFSFVHNDGVGYEIFLEGPNAAGDPNNMVVASTNICAYPDPQFNLAADYCDEDLSTYDLTDGVLVTDASGNGGMVMPASVMIDGLAATTFSPSSLGQGVFVVSLNFDGTDIADLATDAYQGDNTTYPGAATIPAFPGCIEPITSNINIVDCCSATNGTINFGP